ncbi:MAG: hypothetical protein QXW97_02475 [Candidatus Pacearchaeota archaeon]
MNINEEIEKYKKQILEYDISKKRKHFRLELLIIIFAIITLGGFFILIIFLREALTTGFVIGQKEANLYGSVIFVVFLIIWCFLLIQWFIIHKTQEEI